MIWKRADEICGTHSSAYSLEQVCHIWKRSPLLLLCLLFGLRKAVGIGDVTCGRILSWSGHHSVSDLRCCVSHKWFEYAVTGTGKDHWNVMPLSSWWTIVQDYPLSQTAATLWVLVGSPRQDHHSWVCWLLNHFPPSIGGGGREGHITLTWIFSHPSQPAVYNSSCCPWPWGKGWRI